MAEEEDEKRNNPLIVPSSDGGGTNSSSVASFMRSTTLRRIAPDLISSVWLSIVASSVPKLESTVWVVSTTFARRGSTSTVDVAVYWVVALST